MRLKIILFIIFCFYLLIIGRVYFLTIKQHSYYKNLAQENIHKKLYLKPTRGIIYDANHFPVAYNELKFSVLFKPHLKENELNNTIKELSRYLTIKTKKVYKTYKKQNSLYNHQFIPILEYLNYEDVFSVLPIISQNRNIKVESDYLRIYPYKNILSHILGYVGKANLDDIKQNSLLKRIKLTGKNGIEKSYNRYLLGNLGYENVIVNAKIGL